MGRLFLRRRSWVWWLVLGGTGSGVVLTLIGAVLLLVVFFVVISSVFGFNDSKPSQPIAVTTDGMPMAAPSANSVLVSHTWTGKSNQRVVNAALSIAPALYNGPPEGYDSWYDAAKIPQAIAWWQATCPTCVEWQQGNLQCVMLLTAAFGIAGQPLPYVGDAITFLTSGTYQQTSGWKVFSSDSMPEPGDIVVMAPNHVAIIVDVKPPSVNGAGYVQFASANAISAIVQQPLTQAQGHVMMATWPGYRVVGYIRHVAVTGG